MHLLMDELKKFTGYQKYVFLNPEGKKFPCIHPETISDHLKEPWLGKRLSANGWRDVVVTAGQEAGGSQKEISFWEPTNTRKGLLVPMRTLISQDKKRVLEMVVQRIGH